LKIEIVNPIKFAHWDEILLNHPEAAIFHSSNWARVLCEAYGYTPIYFAGFEQGSLKFLLPFMDINSLITGRRGVSLPFTDYCRILIPKRDDLLYYFDMVEKYGKQVGWKYIELRSDWNMPYSLQASTEYYGHTLDLSKGEVALWKGLRGNTRRNIKKAANAGLRVVQENSMEALQQFYMLHCLTRKVHGVPPQPFSFFDKIYENVLTQDLGFVSLVYHGEKIIAGNIYLHFSRNAIYKYGASDMRYQHFRSNNLLQWEAIRWYSNNGYRQLSFGRTNIDNKGLLQFKRGWGAEESKHAYYKYNLKKSSFVKSTPLMGSLLNRVFKNIPLSILGIIGKLLYGHMG
jgi:hypothetical protein